jgi:ATP-binding cassette subfamily B protein IrtA
MGQQSVLSSYLSRKKHLLIGSGFLSIISTITQFVPYYCLYRIIELLILGNFESGEMIQWSLYSIGSVVLSVVFLYASTMSSHIAAFDILYEIRMDLLKHLSKIPMGYFTSNSSGQMVKNIDQSVEKMESFIAHQIPDIVSAIFFPLFYILVMMVVDWRLALFSLIPLFIALVVYGVIMKITYKNSMVKQYHDSLEEMNSNGVEYIRAISAVKIFGLKVHNFKRFHQSIQDYRILVTNWSKSFRGGYLWFVNLILSSVLFVMPFGVFLMNNEPENQAIGLTVMLFIVLASGTGAPFLKLMYAASTFSNVNEGVNRINDMFSVAEIVEKDTMDQFPSNEIEFHSVGFSYTPGVEVLKDVSFRLNGNTLNALVGPSGGGKSTIAQLLLRFYDVPKGKITIGGIDIRDVSIATLMKSVSFVFQDVYLFLGTIEENIRMGNTESSDEDIRRVAAMARCSDFIDHLPEGYQTRIGEGGVFLSKGEAQRISIARALLKNSPILVLDEATAYADSENEVHIQHAIGELVKGKTVLVIAHRLWTIQHADQILVCNHGEIEAQGNHQELLQTSPLYTRLWNINQATAEWKVKENHEKVSL